MFAVHLCAHQRRALCAITAAAGFAGCTAADPAARRVKLPARSAVAVVVENNSLDHLVIYVQDGLMRVRLTEVEALSTKRVFSPELFTARKTGAPVSFVARALAGDAFASESFHVPTQGIPTWVIQGYRPMSFVTVR
jgi:hypothetical protein